MRNLQVSGLVSGMDIETLVTRLMAIERRPVLALEDRQRVLRTRSDSWRDVSNRLNNLLARAEALKNATSYQSRSVTVDDVKVARVTAAAGSSEGSYRLEVIHLAQAHSVASRSLERDSTPLGLQGTVTINGKELAIQAGDTLLSISRRINSLEAGVRAAVLRVQEGDYRLTLTATTTGASSHIAMADDNAVLVDMGLLKTDAGSGELVANTLSAARDAEFRINDLTILRPTNQVSDVVAGLTFSLMAPGTTTVSVDRNVDLLVGMVNSFVEQFNSTMTLVKQQSGAGGNLRGDPALRMLVTRLPGLVFNPVPGATGITRAAEIGLSTGAFGSGMEGLLRLDESVLRAKLAEDIDAVAALFGAHPVNVAEQSAGANASASSQRAGPEFAAQNVINGNTSPELWGTAGGGWSDGTPGEFPDILEIHFGQDRFIDTVSIFTLHSATYPAEDYGIRDWRLEYFHEDQWHLLDTVTGNTAGVHTHRFEAVSTDRIRVLVDAANGANDHSRIVEVQAFAKNDGLASRLADAIKEFTQAASGTVSQRQRGIQGEIERLKKQVEQFEKRLEKREDTLRKQYAAMERALGLMQTQQMWLDQQLKWLAPSKK